MPSPPRDLILLLPFTQALLESPRPILSLIYSSLRRHQSLDSLLVYFSSPCAPHASFDGDTPADVDSESSKGQLYDQLRSRPRATWVAFQRFLSVIYSTLAAAQWEGANEGDGRIHVRVDVGFEGKEGRWEGRFDVCDEMVVLEGYDDLPHPPFPSTATKTLVPCPSLPPSPPSSHTTSTDILNATSPTPTVHDSHDKAYPVVALGGTFDHLHAAHKLLLHSAIFLASRKLIVGVISPSLLGSKAHAAYVEGLEERMEGVREFLLCLGGSAPASGADIADNEQTAMSGSLNARAVEVVLDIVEIHDAFGPTATEQDIQALVISDETRSGGTAVNELRRGKGWEELDVWCIEVISGRRADENEHPGGRSDVEDADGMATSVSTTGSAANFVPEGQAENENVTASHSQEEERGGIKTQSLRGLDEKTLKEVKMGSTGIRAWLAAKAQERGVDALQ